MTTKTRLKAVNSLTARQSPTGKPVPAGGSFEADAAVARELIRLGKAREDKGAAK